MESNYVGSCPTFCSTAQRGATREGQPSTSSSAPAESAPRVALVANAFLRGLQASAARPLTPQVTIAFEMKFYERLRQPEGWLQVTFATLTAPYNSGR
jgi:hypothetical protein